MRGSEADRFVNHSHADWSVKADILCSEKQALAPKNLLGTSFLPPRCGLS